LAQSKLVINRRRQEGNPILKYIRNIPFEWTDIKADFEVGREMGILYLSLKWHKLHPCYIESRMASDLNEYAIKVLLVLVNIDQYSMLRELNLLCYQANLKLVLCYSAGEAAEYLEGLHSSRNKNEQNVVDAFQEKKKKRLGISETSQSTEIIQQAVAFLCSIRSVTTSDAQRLIGTFGSIKAIANADMEKLSLCPGLGPIKAENIYTFFRATFIKK
uniref:DNA excision repair protein ERCC-1 (inferred by orthology to a human protein) n=1 Tax=Anisakis simplex TaxID=6269 RepID=A0A0M3JRU4_ANISI